MKKMDRLFLDDPTLGVLGMQDELRDLGLNYNVKRIRRLLRKMCIEPIYPKKNLSRLGQARYVHPYLLRNLEIDRPNQAWAIDMKNRVKAGLVLCSDGFGLHVPNCNH